MARDFFQRQEESRRQSRFFFVAFAASVFLAAMAFYFAVTLFFMVLSPGVTLITVVLGNPAPTDFLSWALPRAIYGDPARILAVRPFSIIGLSFLAVIAAASCSKILAIRRGGGVYVALTLGGRLLEKPGTLKEKQLVNVVEEMALAAGLPRPEIFILDQEAAINAVTASLDQEDAVIAVTAGALEHLERYELQGVVAHEFAHILNGDCALNLTMAGWLHGLLLPYILGKNLMKRLMGLMEVMEGGARFDAVTPLFLLLGGLGLCLMAGGWLGKFFAELVQAALGRTREYLADAGAVQFTRQPEHLAGALKKIAGFPRQGYILSGQAQAFKPFFIASPDLGGGGCGFGRPAWTRLQALLSFNPFRTHPRLEDRILALTPGWDGRLPKLKLNLRGLRPTATSDLSARKNLVEKLQTLPLDWNGLALLTLAGDLVGPAPNLTEAGRRLLTGLPVELRAAAENPDAAPALVAAVFLQNDDSATAARQAGLIKAALGDEAAGRAAGLSLGLDDENRLPFLCLAAPSLRRLGLEEKKKLNRLIMSLIAAAGRISLFEVAAAQTLKKSLGLCLAGTAAKTAPPLDFTRQLQSDAALLLSALAHAGADGPEEARATFQAAAAHFSSLWPPLPFRPRNEIKIKDLPPLLDRLSQAPGRIKDRLTIAALAAVFHGSQVTPREYALVRALAAVWDRPLPLRA